MNHSPPVPAWPQHPELEAAFDRHPCLLRGAWPEGHATWSIGALDRCLSQGGLGWPEVRLFKDGSEIPAARYTVEAGTTRVTDLDALLGEHAQGATLQAIGVDIFHPPVQALCRAVIDAFSPHIERIHANAYLTPSDARGFDHHWDTHDVIVLQLEGRKHWQVHGTPLPFPAPDQVCGPHRALIDEAVNTTPPLIDTELVPGDVLYLPRGQIHAARTSGACSLHLTLGLHLNTRLHRLERAWQQALSHAPRPPQPLSAPAGVPTRHDTALLTEALAQAVAHFRASSQPTPPARSASGTLIEETLS